MKYDELTRSQFIKLRGLVPSVMFCLDSWQQPGAEYTLDNIKIQMHALDEELNHEFSGNMGIENLQGDGALQDDCADINFIGLSIIGLINHIYGIPVSEMISCGAVTVPADLQSGYDISDVHDSYDVMEEEYNAIMHALDGLDEVMPRNEHRDVMLGIGNSISIILNEIVDVQRGYKFDVYGDIAMVCYCNSTKTDNTVVDAELTQKHYAAKDVPTYFIETLPGVYCTKVTHDVTVDGKFYFKDKTLKSTHWQQPIYSNL